MLNDDEGIPLSREAPQDAVHAVHVARVKADRRLVQDEKRIDEIGAERGREVDALHFAPGERSPLTVHREIAEPHVAEEGNAREAFAQNERLGLVVLLGVQALEKMLQHRCWHEHELMKVEAGKHCIGFL